LDHGAARETSSVRLGIWIAEPVSISLRVPGQGDLKLMVQSTVDFLPAQCDPRLRAVADYWSRLPPTAPGVPSRRDFDPLDLPPRLLRHIWMVDVEVDPPRFRFRLCGSHLVEALGFDPTGRDYTDVFPDFAKSDTFAALSRVRDLGEPSWRAGDPKLVSPAHEIRLLERVFLPLTRDGQRVDIVLAASIYKTLDGNDI